MIYTKQQIVGSTQVGANAKLSVMGLFGVVETAITECMGTLNIDAITVKREYNAFWVFTKNRIKILKDLGWGESFYVESFVSSLSSAKLVIDTAVKNLQGEIAAYSSCEMCVLDIATGRIRRTSTVGIDDSFVVEQPQMYVEFEKIDDSDIPAVEDVTVRSTNIDFSQHCNNVEYLRFLFNTYSVEELANRPVSEIEVCYINQSYEGDRLTVHKQSSKTCDTLSIKKDGKTVIKCVISF
ncbi:MAG: acyl-ACP thioesterase [Clostridiales bacterium]|nr:acyl-ACP thioesterase [Clostridiales bacterium]